MKIKRLIHQTVILSLLINIFFVTTVLAQNQMTDEEFQKKLTEFKESGDLRKVTDDFASLSVLQRIKLIEQIPEGKFWAQWEDLDESVKRSFSRSLNQIARDEFMKKLSSYYGVEFTGFDKNTNFGVDGVLGNPKTYINTKKIKEFNKNAKDPIKKIEYKKDGEVDIMKITKQSGSSVEIIAGKDKPGYYFDPKTNRLHQSNDGSSTQNPFAGVWNGNGQLTVDTSGEDPKISLDYVRNNGIADITKYATFTRDNGDSFSTMQKPHGVDEKGNKQYDLLKAEISFNAEGKVTKITDAYAKTATFGGYFGKEVSIFHAVGDFDSLSEEDKKAIGSYLIVDVEKGILRGDVARNLVSRDVASDFKNLKSIIGDAKDRLAELAGSVNRLSPSDLRKAIALGTGLDEENPLLFALGVGKSLISKVFDYGLGHLTSAENIASIVQYKAESQVFNVPNEDTFLSVHIPNDMAQKLNNVDLRGGRLSIEDSRGKLVNIVNQATPYNYFLNPNFNKDNPSLSGINFNLRNANIPEQQIQIYSDNQGKLTAVGIGKTALEIYGGRLIEVEGNVHVGGRFGFININRPFRQKVVSFDYQADPKTIQEAKDFLTKSSLVEDFRQLRARYIADGLTVTETQELQNLARQITQNYYQILTKGDSQFTIQGPQIGESLNELAYQLDTIARSEPAQGNANLPVEEDLINQALSLAARRVLSDTSLQDQFVQRDLNEKTLLSAGKKQLSDIAYFLRTNSGNSVSFVEDSKNKLYQLKVGSQTLNIDPALGPFVSDVLPMIVGSAGRNAQGKVYIDPYAFANNRFLGGYKRDVFYTSRSYRLLEAARMKEAGIQAEIQAYFQEVIPKEYRTPSP